MIHWRALISVAIACISLGNAYGSNWTMGRFDPAQTGFTTEKVTLPLAVSWEHASSKFDNNPASPVVSDGTAYFASGDRIYAVDSLTGVMKWRYPSDQGLSGAIKATPTVYNNSVYFGAADGNLYCVDAVTGTFQWAYQTRGAIRCAPVISDGVIFFGSDDNSLYAVEAATGDAAWNQPITFKDDVSVGVAVGAGMVIASAMDGNIYGVNSNNGKLKWFNRLPTAPRNTSPVIAGNVVVMALGDVAYGLTARSGQLRWALKLPSECAATPATDGQNIYFACLDQKVYAYTITTRTPVLKWAEGADVGSKVVSSPVIANDLVIVAANKGVMCAFAALDGSLKWRYIAAPSQVTAAGSGYVDAACSPAVSDGAVYMLTDDGVLRCFKPDAADCEAPAVYEISPANARAMSGAPPIKISAILYDIGSGVDFSSVSITLDNKEPLEYTTNFNESRIVYYTEVGGEGKAVTRLPDGIHTITMTARDYSGNLLTRNWFFYADNSLPPPRKATKDAPGKQTKEPPRPKPNMNQPPIPNMPDDGAGGDGMEMPPPPPPMPNLPDGAPTPPMPGGRRSSHNQEAPAEL